MKKQKIFIIVLISVLVCAAGVGAFLLGRDKQTGKSPVQEVTASDEDSLRKLLLEDSEMIITVDEDIEIDEQFVVNGTKTLKGDARLKMLLSAEFGQYVLSLSENATVTMDGLVLDGNYIASGIYVPTGAEVTYLSGSIEYTERSGLVVSGKLTVKDVLINEAQHCGILVDNGSEVSIEGGSIINAESTSVYIAQAGHLSISGDTLFDTCRKQMVYNEGVVDITGGTFANCSSYTLYNSGILNVAASEKNAVEIYGGRTGAVYTLNTGETKLDGAYIHDTSAYAVLSTGGKTDVSNCTFEKTGNNAMDLRAGTISVKNVEIISPTNAGIEVKNDCVATLENITITDCTTIGISGRGGNITGKNIKITNVQKYGIAIGNRDDYKAIAKLTDVEMTGVNKYGVYLYNEGSAEIENLTMSDFVGERTTGVVVLEGCNFVLGGNGKISKMPYRAIHVKGTCVMNGGQICDNVTAGGGAGVYVEKGTFTMNGGEIYNNVTPTRGGGICVGDGSCIIDGGKIYNNTSLQYGGGITVMKEGKLYLKSGEIKNNQAPSGDGIFVSGSCVNNPVIGENFYLGGNDVKVDTAKIMLQIEGSSLKKHTEKDPLLITPNYSAAEGTKVASCKTSDIANALAVKVKSGDGSYKLVKDDKFFVTSFAVADMDMTGADTVRVSNFAELKEAITGTSGKRYVVLEANIVMESEIRLTGGSTICITDDGNQRTLSRAAETNSVFFKSHYGTGLYIKSSQKGNLILDGSCSGKTDMTKISPLVYVYGSTVIDGVVLKDNGSLESNNLKGALVRQNYGDLSIYNSAFSGGAGYTGGAVYVSRGELYVADSTFTDNRTNVGGGAIRTQGEKTQIVNSTFTSNHAGGSGGAVVSVDGKKLTITDCHFESNEGISGGAVAVLGEDNYAIISNNQTEAAFVGNSAKTGGAIYIADKVCAVINGYTFENNTSTRRGGAIASELGENVSLIGLAFYNNATTGSGGAVSTNAGILNVVSCEFGKENAGNRADDKGGAILVTGNSTVDLSLTSGYTYNSFNYNKGATSGGAICIHQGTVTSKGYIFTGNESARGGAIFLYENGTATFEQNEYVKNVATESNGGAVNCSGTFTDIDGVYRENNGRNGGGLFVAENAKAVLSGSNGKFIDNTSNVRGGAIYANVKSSLTVHDYDFAGSNEGDKGVICFRSATTFGNVKNAIFDRYDAEVELTVDGYEETNNVTIVASKYASGLHVLTKAENMTDEMWTCAHENISLSDSAWLIDENGNLKTAKELEASITLADGTPLEFDTLVEAVDYANENGGTGDTEAIVITVLSDVTVTGRLEIKKNIQIVNAPGKDIKIVRGTEYTSNGNSYADMFYLKKDSSLIFTLGSTDQTATGTLIIDGSSDEAIKGRTVDVRETATFILGYNATLQGAHSTETGAAIVNRGTVTLYGTIKDNQSSKAKGAGAIYQVGGSGVLTIEAGTYTGNKNTTAGAKGGFIGSAGKAGEVKIKDGTFSGNEATYGGVMYAPNGQTLTVTGGTFTGNTATAGGAFYVENNGGVYFTDATITGNTANAESADTISGGGAICIADTDLVTASRVVLRRSTVTGNTADGKAGCDIAFNLASNASKKKEAQLNLKEYTTFEGIVGWYGAGTADSTTVVNFVAADGTNLGSAKPEHGNSYVVDYEETTINKMQ